MSPKTGSTLRGEAAWKAAREDIARKNAATWERARKNRASRNAAIVHSQGREPLESLLVSNKSPNGATVTFAPMGLCYVPLIASRG